MIICATGAYPFSFPPPQADLTFYTRLAGYDTSFLYPFPVIGRNGVDVRALWTPHPVTYLSVATAGFPNWFAALGPNAGVGSGSLLAQIEQQVDYAVQAAMKMQRERLKSIEVKETAMRDFDRYLEVSAVLGLGYMQCAQC